MRARKQLGEHRKDQAQTILMIINRQFSDVQNCDV